MIQSQILQPVVVLLAWTMIMWLWMYATRIPAMSEAGIEPNDARRTKALDETLRGAERVMVACGYRHSMLCCACWHGCWIRLHVLPRAGLRCMRRPQLQRRATGRRR